MKLRQKTIAVSAAIFTALFLVTNHFPALTARADSLTENTDAPQESAAVSDEESPQETTAETEAETFAASDKEPLTESTVETEAETFAASDKEPLTESTSETETETFAASDKEPLTESTSETETETFAVSDGEPPQESDTETETESSAQSGETTSQTQELGFHAGIEYSPQGYVVIGTFTDFPTDVIHIRLLYATDGKNYQECGREWDAMDIKTYLIAETKRLTCLYSKHEPLKSYLEDSIDCFYLKLRLTGESGVIYETQTVLIDRGAPQPLPEEVTPIAKFPSNMFVREMRPFRCYGRYQITIDETAAPGDISAVLPDTLPIEVQLLKKGEAFATGIVDCPVTWKSLSLPPLTAGESVTVEDAAEEIIIPGGTLIRTPLGIFRLDEPLGIGQGAITDEIRLVLNIVSKDANPTGVLKSERDGLEMAFLLKPTGATSIQVYTISENETRWTELPELALLEAINAQPSTANSGYALILRKDQEPYRSYLAAKAAGTPPTPFYVGLKIKGGVYDGRQLILVWPDYYELPPNLPKLGGAGGNESNAGAGNKGDSTPEGQRPGLPQNTDPEQQEQNPNPPQNQETQKTNTKNPSTESAAEIPTESDIENQETPASSDSSAFTLHPIKVQAAANTEENSSETDITDISKEASAADVQNNAHTENAASKTHPAESKLSASLAPSNRSRQTGCRPLLWAAAVAGIGIILYTRRTAGSPADKIAGKVRKALHRISLRK